MRPPAFWRIIRDSMFAHRRYGRERPQRTTVGDVFSAISSDAWARERLGAVYRKLFEGGGVRQGSSPNYFIYVEPGRARQEIGELSTWVTERFGEPVGTVPIQTPFGYLSGCAWRYGWITLFAARAHDENADLTSHFNEAVAPMSWASHATSRYAVAGEPPAQVPAPASSPPVAPPPPPEKPGLLERVFGVRPRVLPVVSEQAGPVSRFAARPTPAAPPPREGAAEEDDRGFEEMVGRMALAQIRARHPGMTLREALHEESRAQVSAGRGRQAMGGGLLGERVGDLSSRVGALGGDEGAGEGARVRESLAEQQRLKREALQVDRRVFAGVSQTERQQARREVLAERERLEAEAAARAEEEREKRSTVEQLRRPENPNLPQVF